jgi:hypothetical protein
MLYNRSIFAAPNAPFRATEPAKCAEPTQLNAAHNALRPTECGDGVGLPQETAVSPLVDAGAIVRRPVTEILCSRYVRDRSVTRGDIYRSRLPVPGRVLGRDGAVIIEHCTRAEVRRAPSAGDRAIGLASRA